jgi:hypothetical protein
MPWLSFLITIAYIPGVTGAALATGWAAMSFGLPIVTWRDGATLASPIIPLCAIAFFTYAFTSLTWVDNPDTALSTLWQYALMAGAFYAGTQTPDLRRATIGLVLGFGVSSLLCIPQALGLDWIIEYIPCRPSGLMFNPIILGEGCAITILLCLSYRMWWLAGLLIPGLLLSQSRGAFVALAVGLVLTYCRPQRGMFSFAPIWTTCSFSDAVTHGEANDFRLMVWRVLYHFLDFWGHGAGSVEAVIIRFRGNLYAPGYAHNEFLDLAYQYGVGALPAALILLIPAANAGRDEWPAYVAFAVCCLFSFPLHCPPLAFLGMVVAGNLARDWSLSRLREQLRGPRALSSLAHTGAGARGLADQLAD